MNCPSCKRWAEDTGECPYCGVDLPRPGAVWRWAMPLVALGTLASLILLGPRQATPQPGSPPHPAPGAVRP